MSIKQISRIAKQLKNLNTSLIDQHIDSEHLNDIEQTLQSLQQSIQSLTISERQIDHFDFSKVNSDPISILPFGPVFGPLNAISHDAELSFDHQRKRLIANLSCCRSHEGPPNCVHGGSIAAIYDQLLAFMSIYNQTAGHTVTLNIEYLKATPINAALHFETWIEKKDGRKITIKGLCKVGEDIVSRAEGLFIEYTGNA